MEYACMTPLRGSLIVTDDFHSKDELLRNKDLYKFIWVLDGSVDMQIDHGNAPGKPADPPFRFASYPFCQIQVIPVVAIQQ